MKKKLVELIKKFNVIRWFIVLFVTIVVNPILLRSQEHIQFILISYVGNRDYFVSPIVISADTIERIEFFRGIYDQHLKYESVYKYVISEEHFKILFNSLNIFQMWRERPLRFLDISRNECGGLKLIVDFRDENGKDYEMVSLRTYYETLLFLKMVYCFVTVEQMNEDLAFHLSRLYKMIYDMSKPQEIEENLRCK